MKNLTTLIITFLIALSLPVHADIPRYRATVPLHYLKEASGKVFLFYHSYNNTGAPVTVFVKTVGSGGPGVVGNFVVDTNIMETVLVEDGHIEPHGSSERSVLDPLDPGTADKPSAGTATGIDPGYAATGNFILGIIRMGGNADFLVAGVSTSAAAKIHKNLQEVGVELGKMNYVANRMDRGASANSGTLVPLAPGLSKQIGSTIGDFQPVHWEEAQLNYVNDYSVHDTDKVSDDLKKNIKNNNLDELADKAELIATTADNSDLARKMGDRVKDGVLQVTNNNQQGPWNDTKLKTPSDSIHGKMIRRAINKNQVAWQKYSSYPNSPVHDVIDNNVSMINIADNRLSNPAAYSDAQLRQAEGLVITAEKAAEFAGGLAEGAKDALVDMAEDILAIHELGESLYDYLESAIENPAAAYEQAADVISKTPEFVEEMYDSFLKRMDEFPGLSAAEQGKLIGEIAAEAGVAVATAGAGSVALKGVKAARMGRAMAATRRATGAVTNKVRKVIGDAQNVKPVRLNNGKLAKQAITKEALVARGRVESGRNMYKLGRRNQSFTGNDSQFWSLEHPSTPGYGQRYGIPEENLRNADFIEIATIKKDGHFITRKAPSVGNNKGGSIEVVTNRDSIKIESHTSIDRD